MTTTHVFSLVIDGTDLFAAGRGIFRSSDHGVTWFEVSTGLTNLNVLSLAVQDGYIYAGNEIGVYSSFNKGETWIPFRTGLEGTTIHSLTIGSTRIIAGTHAKGVFIRPISEAHVSIRAGRKSLSGIQVGRSVVGPNLFDLRGRKAEPKLSEGRYFLR